MALEKPRVLLLVPTLFVPSCPLPRSLSGNSQPKPLQVRPQVPEGGAFLRYIVPAYEKTRIAQVLLAACRGGARLSLISGALAERPP